MSQPAKQEPEPESPHVRRERFAETEATLSKWVFGKPEAKVPAADEPAVPENTDA